MRLYSEVEPNHKRMRKVTVTPGAQKLQTKIAIESRKVAQSWNVEDHHRCHGWDFIGKS